MLTTPVHLRAFKKRGAERQREGREGGKGGGVPLPYILFVAVVQKVWL